MDNQKDRKDRMLDRILETVGYDLYRKKTRQSLESGLLKNRREIEFLEDKIAAARKHLDGTREEEKKIAPRLAELEKLLSGLQQEKAAAESRFLLIKKIERAREEKGDVLPEIKANLSSLMAYLHEASKKNDFLQEKLQRLISEKEVLTKENSRLEKQIASLSMQIPVMQSTRDLMSGVRPDDIDEESFDLFKGDFVHKTGNYLEDMLLTIAKLEAECSELQTRADQEKKMEETLLIRKDQLRETIEEAAAELGEEINNTTLEVEIHLLHDKMNPIAQNNVQLLREIEKVTSEIKAVERALSRQKIIGDDLRKEQDELTAIKQSMEMIGDVEAEIGRLQSGIHEIRNASNVDVTLSDFIGEIKGMMVSNDDPLRNAVNDYHRRVVEFEEVMDELQRA